MEFLPEWVRVQERPWSWGKENNNQQQGTRRAEQQGRVANFMSERERGLVAAVLSLLARSAFPTGNSTGTFNDRTGWLHARFRKGAQESASGLPRLGPSHCALVRPAAAIASQPLRRPPCRSVTALFLLGLSFTSVFVLLAFSFYWAFRLYIRVTNLKHLTIGW